VASMAGLTIEHEIHPTKTTTSALAERGEG
jgi:hypothetical protein